MEHKCDTGDGLSEEHKGNHRSRIVVEEIWHVWRSGGSLAAKRHAMRPCGGNKPFLQGGHGISRPCARNRRVGMVLRVAEEPAAAKVLVEELAVVDTEARHLGNFVGDRAHRPVVSKAHVVSKLLSVVTIADSRGNLALWSAHHVTAKVLVLETLFK